MRRTPLREIIEEALLKHNFLIEEDGVQVDVPQELPTVNVDVEKMREAICALISDPTPNMGQPPSTVTRLPYSELMVVVTATALPRSSTME